MNVPDLTLRIRVDGEYLVHVAMRAALQEIIDCYNEEPISFTGFEAMAIAEGAVKFADAEEERADGV